MSDLAPGVTLGDYRIEAVLGRGAMSTVYRAERLSLGQLVALKIVDPALSEDEAIRARFERERRIAASLRHPNIVPLLDAGEVDGLLYLAMVFVEGSDLRHLLDHEGALAPPRGIALLSQVASALDSAHAQGLVHRDIKPANILVTSTPAGNGSEHVYLADFGLTKQIAATSTLSRRGGFTGTLDYAAPEQFRGGPIDRRADVYALSCVLYECLTGDVPFPRDSEAALMHAHLEAAMPSVRLIKPELPKALDAVIAKGTAREPDDRYGSAGALIGGARTALLQLVSTEPSPHTPDERKIVRRGTIIDEPPPPPAPAPLPTSPPPKDMNRVAFLVAGMIVLAGVLLGGSLILNTGGTSPAPTLTPGPNSEGLPTTGTEALVRDLFADVVAATRAGNGVSMLARLHPAVIDRYGEGACREQLSSFTDPRYAIVVDDILPPAAWDYTSDGLTTTVEDTWTVKATVTSEGTTSAQDVHAAPVDGEPRWFRADCGDPLPAAELKAAAPRAYVETCVKADASVDTWGGAGVLWIMDCYPRRAEAAAPATGEELPGVIRYVLFKSANDATAWVGAVDGIGAGASTPIPFDSGSAKCESPGSSSSGPYTLDQQAAGILKCFQINGQASLLWTVDARQTAMWAVDDPVGDAAPDASAFHTWWATATNWFSRDRLPTTSQ